MLKLKQLTDAKEHVVNKRGMSAMHGVKRDAMTTGGFDSQFRKTQMGYTDKQ